MSTNNTTTNPQTEDGFAEMEELRLKDSPADKENKNITTYGGKENTKNSNSNTTSNSARVGLTSSTTAATNTTTSTAAAKAPTAANRSPRPTVPTPLKIIDPKTDGWAMELECSEKQYKNTRVDDEGSNHVLFRLLQAQFKMRKFDDLMKVTSDEKGQKIIETSFTPQQIQVLGIYKAKGDQILEISTSLAEEEEQHLLKSFRRGKKNLNLSVFCPSGNDEKREMNTNMLQISCINGDIRLMEAVIAHGASIDQPFLDRDPERPDEPWLSNEMIPTTITPLTFVCAMIVYLSRARFTADWEDKLVKKQIECVVQLVNLGADCTSQLSLPPPERKLVNMVETFRTLGFDGKTAYELGMMTKNQRLIDAMNRMKTTDDKIKNAHCRCGSRLPWLQCHAGSREEIHNRYHIGGTKSASDKERVIFRLSPTANCPCNKNTDTTKTYFKCCWKETVNPTYLDDTTFEHIDPNIFELREKDISAQTSVLSNYSYRVGTWGKLLGLEPDSLSEVGKKLSRIIRDDPEKSRASRQDRIVCRSGRRSVAYDSWDMEVYAGIMERITNPFELNDLHWDIPNRELTTRVDEWNTALDNYCDDIGLEEDDEERQSIVNLHTASPFAPCANPSCTNTETFVKEFLACSRCRRVRYCSRGCQVSNWKVHKKACRRFN